MSAEVTVTRAFLLRRGMRPATAFVAVALAALLLLASLSPAFAARRAFVVGIDDYQHLPKLQKAVGDARAMAATLETLGFREPKLVLSPDRRTLAREWDLFLRSLAGDDEVAVPFSGHGVQLGGRNYLIAANAPKFAPAEEALLRREAFALDELLDDLARASARIKWVVLDACRDNPFADATGRSIGGTRGLAVVAPPKGVFLLYAAGSSQQALDRLSELDADPNSLFTRSLLPLLKTPGLSLVDIAKRVKQQVEQLAQRIGHEQRPAYYDELSGDWFPAGEKQPEQAPVPASAPGEAARLWEAEKLAESKDAELLEAYARQFATSDPFWAGKARRRRQQLAALGEGAVEENAPRPIPQTLGVPDVPAGPMRAKTLAKAPALLCRPIGRACASCRNWGIAAL